MPDLPHLLAFVLAGLLLNLTPGVDVFYIVGHALRQGWRAGVVAALGITAGCCVHIVAAAVGVSAIVATSATAFTVLKWVGAAYLVWIGVQMLRRPGALQAGLAAQQSPQAEPLARVFRGGFLTNVLNPKVALFFLAFVPQFVDPAAAHPGGVFLLLGLLFNFNALWVCIGWAALAAWLARRLDRAGTVLRWAERAAGLMVLGFGLKLAFSDAPSR